MWLLWIIVAVSGRIIGSCAASVWQKRLFIAGETSFRIVAVSMSLAAVFVTACDWRLPSKVTHMPSAFWTMLTVAALLDTIGNVLLVRSVGIGELSIVGPLNSYKPVIATILGFLFFSEVPSVFGIGGMAAILMGSRWLNDAGVSESPSTTFQYKGAVAARLISILFTSVASLFLKSAVELSNSRIAFECWLIVSAVAAWVMFGLCRGSVAFDSAAAGVRKRVKPSCSVVQALDRQSTFPRRSVDTNHGGLSNRSRLISLRYLGLAAALVLMQSLTVWLFSQMSVGYALALFQLSSLVQVGLGAKLFGEGNSSRRATAAAAMTIGAVVILLNR